MSFIPAISTIIYNKILILDYLCEKHHMDLVLQSELF